MPQGVVSKIMDRQFGDKKLYSFILRNEKTWYGLGAVAPTFKEGDSIQFDAEQKGQYWNARNVSPWTGAGIQEGTSVAEVSKSSSWPTRNAKRPFQGAKSQEEKDYWNERQSNEAVTQKRIEIQAARNAAIETAKLLIENGLVAVPATKKAQGLEFADSLINELVDNYLANTAVRLEDGPAIKKIVKEVFEEGQTAESARAEASEDAEWA